jgi:enamine deaminase RidA (YjgF/YER057c/UK114 family)
MAYSHVRLRKFNTAKTYPEQKLDNDLSMSVRASNFVFLRGQVGQALDGRNVGIGDAAAQTEQAMRNVKQLLEEQGA